MGFVGLQVKGNGEVGWSAVSLASRNKYKRMDSELTDDHDDSSHHHHQEDRSKSTSRYVFAAAVFASLNYVFLGYDGGVMSGAIIFIQEEMKISEVQQEVLVGILNVFSLFGSLAGGRTSDAIGRKWTMALAVIIFQVGSAVMTFAPTFQILMFGRIMTGVGVGFGGSITPIYIAEISPPVARGSLTSFPEIFVNFGILLGYISNYIFAGLPANINWRIMLGVGILPSVIIAFALFIIPESPRWLVMQNRVQEARSVLLKTNGNEREVEERLAEIQADSGMANDEKYEEKAVWREILSPSPALRRTLIAGLGIQCFQQITGIDSTVCYSPEIFKEAGIEGNSNLLAATVAVGVTKTSFILVAILLIDKLGRKPLLYLSTIGMTICLFILGLSLSIPGQGQFGVAMSIISVCANVAFFSVGIGPICWVLASEIYPLRVRAQAGALGMMGNRLCSGLITMSFLSVARAITVGGTFLVFSAISALSVLFIYKFVPETKGKSLEQIGLLFQNAHERQGGALELADAERLVPKD